MKTFFQASRSFLVPSIMAVDFCPTCFSLLMVCVPGYYNDEGAVLDQETSAKADKNKGNSFKARLTLRGSGPLDQFIIEDITKNGGILEDFAIDIAGLTFNINN